MKSLSALSLAVSVALGRPAFGADRFTVGHTLRVAFMTEEDSRGLVAARVRWLLAGLGADIPETLWLSARRGLTFEDAASRAEIADTFTALRIDLAIFDTARAFAPTLDKGPFDGAPAVRFLRTLMSDTPLRGIAVVHHDVKPGRDGQDGRTRAEKLSGGALLAAADCPIGFERLSDRATLAVPDLFKPSADPPPFRLDFASATPPGEAFRDHLRVACTTTDQRTETDERTLKSVLAALDDADGWLSANALAQRAGLRRQDVYAGLKKLADRGRVLIREAPRGREYRHGIS
jgi:hypothetical protein